MGLYIQLYTGRSISYNCLCSITVPNDNFGFVCTTSKLEKWGKKLLATWNAAYTYSIWNPRALPLDLLFMLYLDDPVSLDARIPNALLSSAVSLLLN